jgi:beta-lactamase regulating signal transducer with metallopeptidase domain
MTPALNVQSLAQLSAERILNCTAEGMVIALLAWLLLRALGRQNSGTRFAVWFAALLGIAALPFLGTLTSSGAGLSKPSEITMPGSWALYIFGAWFMIAAAGLLRVGIGFWRLHGLRKSCVPVDPAMLDAAKLDPALRNTLAEFDSPRSVQLCVSDALRVPTAIGFMRPMVVIPSWAMRELSGTELNAILLHELAHLRRRDDWTNLVQKIVGAVFFFHPAVWWIEKKLTLEREMACDDLVLARTETTNPRAYAECLVSLAEKSFLRRGLSLAQAAVGRLRHVSLRVSQILDADRPSATRVWRPALVLVSGVSLVCLIALAHTPARLVSFESSPAATQVSSAVAASDFEASPISPMGARVVPAKLVLSPEKPVVKGSVNKAVNRTVKADVVHGSSVKQDAKAPRLVRTSLRDNNVPSRTLFLVRTEFVQTEQYDASGALVWNLCVWHVTVVPVENKMAGIAAKSI